MAVNSVDIKLLNGSKQEVSYTGVETITIPKAVGSGVETFTAGIPLDSSAVQITPDFTSGNMVVDAPSGYVVRDAVLLKPSGMESVIGKGESLMGVAGEYVTPGTTKSVSLDFSSGDMSIAASGDERWSQLDIFKPATLIPENIVGGVTIAGVTGTLEGFPAEIFEMSHTSAGSGPYVLSDKLFNHPPSTFAMFNFSSNGAIGGIDLSQVTKFNASFSNCSNLSYVSLANCSKIAYNNAFGSCTALTDVYLPVCDSLPSNCFAGCSALSTVYIPSLSVINGGTFNGCKSLVSVALNPDVQDVASTAFSGCTMLSTLSGSVYYISTIATSRTSTFANQVCTLSEGTTVLAGSIFTGCSSMSGVQNLNSIKAIGSSAFLNCQKMGGDISLPYCTHIGLSAFCSCYSITGMYAPMLSSVNMYTFAYCSSLTYFSARNMSGGVGISAFRNCSSLSTVVLGGPFIIAGSVFYSCYRLISLYLLGSSVCSLTSSASYVFKATPMYDYSTIAGRYGSVFVRESLVNAYKTNMSWRVMASRFVGMTDAEIEEFLGGN